jgi:uncharacterized DUF497 family protein
MNDRHFEWDEAKDMINIAKHGVSFVEAMTAFDDHDRVITRDILHSNGEQRWFCFGRTVRGVLTVRFTYRDNKIRIFGAGYWRQGRSKYERNKRRENE